MFALKEYLKTDPIIVSVSNEKELKAFLEQETHHICCLKTGSVNNIENILDRIRKHGGHALIHQDSIKGVAKDQEGIEYLRDVGAEAIITMQSRQVGLIKKEKLFSILGSFLIDTSSVHQTIRNISQTDPDAVLIMPMSVPKSVYDNIGEVNECILAGGMGVEHGIIQGAIDCGARGCIITSQQRAAEVYRVK